MFKNFKYSEVVIISLALTYFAVLPMSGTMAFRNICLFLSLVLITKEFFYSSDRFFSWIHSWPIFLWCFYLLFFLFTAQSFGDAIANISGQWVRGVIAIFLGTGLAFLMHRMKYDSLFILMCVSFIPIAIHLIFIINNIISLGYFPWGSWGRESHHADLGYAAGQTMILAMAVGIYSPVRFRFVSFFIAFSCLLSMTIAYSRAGFVFVIIAGMIVLFFSALNNSKKLKYTYILGTSMLIATSMLLIFVSQDKNQRWHNMASDLQVGLLGNPIEVVCRGPEVIQEQIYQNYGSEADRIFFQIREGDAVRLLALRAGLELAVENPWGWNGSRHAFQQLIAQKCEQPTVKIAHTHNGWLDTVLALGWMGALLYLVLCLSYVHKGWASLSHHNENKKWAVVLVAITIFWMIRGFFDSVFRDHMLEMQGFMLGFVSTALYRGYPSPSDIKDHPR